MPRAPITRAHPYIPGSGSFAGQMFTSERQYRNALARQKGFTSLAGMQRAVSSVIHTAAQYARLGPRQQEARERALHALSRLKAGQNLDRAARDANTTVGNVLKYAGAALEKRGGRYEAKPQDRLFRRLRILDDKGSIFIDVKDSRTATKIGDYWNAVDEFSTGKGDAGLRRFRDKFVTSNKRHYPFVTDPDTLERLGRAGELSFESIYENVA